MKPLKPWAWNPQISGLQDLFPSTTERTSCVCVVAYIHIPEGVYMSAYVHCGLQAMSASACGRQELSESSQSLSTLCF